MRAASDAVILRCPRNARASKDGNMQGFSSFEARKRSHLRTMTVYAGRFYPPSAPCVFT